MSYHNNYVTSNNSVCGMIMNQTVIIHNTEISTILLYCIQHEIIKRFRFLNVSRLILKWIISIDPTIEEQKRKKEKTWKNSLQLFVWIARVNPIHGENRFLRAIFDGVRIVSTFVTYWTYVCPQPRTRYTIVDVTSWVWFIDGFGLVIVPTEHTVLQKNW